MAIKTNGQTSPGLLSHPTQGRSERGGSERGGGGAQQLTAHRIRPLFIRQTHGQTTSPYTALTTSQHPLPPEVHDWVIQGLGMSCRVCATGHTKDPVQLIEKSRASCPGGRFPPSFIRQVIIITGLSMLYGCMFPP